MTIRDIRRKKGISLRALAGTTGLTRGYLSKIERAKGMPPVSTLQTIAYALGTDLADLLPVRTTPSGASKGSRNIEIVRGGKSRMSRKDGDADYAYRPLLASYQNKQMCPVLMSVPKGSTKPYTHDSEEFGFVLSGTVTLRYEGEAYELKPDDAFYFDSRVPHSFANDDEKEAVVLVVNFNYRRF